MSSSILSQESHLNIDDIVALMQGSNIQKQGFNSSYSPSKNDLLQNANQFLNSVPVHLTTPQLLKTLLTCHILLSDANIGLQFASLFIKWATNNMQESVYKLYLQKISYDLPIYLESDQLTSTDSHHYDEQPNYDEIFLNYSKIVNRLNFVFANYKDLFQLHSKNELTYQIFNLVWKDSLLQYQLLQRQQYIKISRILDQMFSGLYTYNTCRSKLLLEFFQEFEDITQRLRNLFSLTSLFPEFYRVSLPEFDRKDTSQIREIQDHIQSLYHREAIIKLMEFYSSQTNTARYGTYLIQRDTQNTPDDVKLE